MRVPVARLRRVRGVGRWLGMQIAVAVVAAVGVSAMFAAGSRAPAPPPILAESGKSVRRVAHEAGTDGTVLQFDAQQQAARASPNPKPQTPNPKPQTPSPSRPVGRFKGRAYKRQSLLEATN